MARKALIVGIDNYDLSRAIGPGPKDLPGCANDAIEIRVLLSEVYGFGSGEMQSLLSKRATTKRIKSKLDWLVRDATAGDTLFFYFSGHGGFARLRKMDVDDDDGFATGGLRDKLSEFLCPADYNIDRESFVSDALMKQYFEDLPPGVRMEAVLDCCHAGGILETIPVSTAQTDAPTAPGGVVPADIAARADDGEDLPTASITGTLAARRKKTVAWQACMEGQESFTVSANNRRISAFTHSLCAAIRELGPTARRRSLLSRARQLVRGFNVNQKPILTCKRKTRDKPFLWHA